MKTSKIILPIIVLAAMQTTAQNPMNLKDCLQYAVENSTSIAIEDERIKEYSIERRDAWLNAISPSVTGSASVAASSGRLTDPETNVYTTLKTIQDSYQIHGEITLFNGFNAVNRIKIAKIALLTGKESRKAKEDEICLSTIQQYFNYTYYSKMSSLAQLQLSNAALSLQKVKREYELGNKSQQDVLEKEVFEAQAQYTFAEYNAQQNKALMELKKVMFYPADQNLVVDTLIENNFFAEISDVDATAQNAVETNFATINAKNNMDIRQLELKTARWQMIPSIGIEAGWNTYHTYYPENKEMGGPFNDQIKNHAKKYVGAGISIPLYNRFSKFSNQSHKKAEYQIASFEYEERRREIENAVYAAYDDAISAGKSLEAAKKSAELNQKYFEAAQKKFDLGTISYIDYNDVFNNYLESQAKYYNAIFDYRIKNAVIDYYRGKSYLEQF